MKHIRGLVLVAIVIVGLTGCTPHKQAKVEAYQRWHDTRAKMLVSVGEEQFRSGELKAASESAGEALSLSPKMALALVLTARVAIEQGKYLQAERYLKTAAELNPKSGKIVYLMAVVAERRGRLADALRLYEKARALEGDNPAYVLASAEVMVAMGQGEHALALIEGKLTCMEASVGMYMAAGELAALAGNSARAWEHYSQAQLLAPEDDLQVLECMAKAGFFAGRYDDAAGILERLSGEKAYDQQPWVLAMLGESQLAAGRPKQAKASFFRLTELAPAEPRNWVNLAKAALLCGDLPRAILSAEEALRLEPEAPEASILLGYALLGQGMPGPANAVLARSAQAHKDHAMLQCLLGRSYGALGKTAEANRCYRMTLEIEPGNLVAKQLLASVAE
ncbi:MAG: tetratricopeptide repeat protein [Planctomycetes bacterium]|nr:tetratricopeptide repeat protein [Planctomycetota bacterium]